MIRSPGLKIFAPTQEDDADPTAIESRVAKGLRVAVDVGSKAHAAAQTLGIDLYALIELLIAKGVVHLHEFEERKKALAPELEASAFKVEQAHDEDKYNIDPTRLPSINCAERMHLCRGHCCRLVFGLTASDLAEGVVRWEYGRPYRIRHRAEDDRCVHQDPEDLHCTVYENRPAICRTYSCIEDKRIWLDFEKMIPNPDLPP
jgi:Fe-S-cluster containining protein